MTGFRQVKGRAVAWLIPNIDTDVISPMKRLLHNMDELDRYSFEAYRYVNGDGDAGILNMDFPLNRSEYANAKILITGENFGCGSSRETAPEAIAGMGIRCLIGSSFAGIFTKNCYQQGILPITLDIAIVHELAALAETLGDFEVDLVNSRILTPHGKVIGFAIEEHHRQSLLCGIDDVGVTLGSIADIDDFFCNDTARRPWLYPIC